MKYVKGSFITVPNSEQLKGIPSMAQTLFMWMCYHANQDGKCFPSIATLSKEAGLSKDSIIKATKQLVDLGMIKKVVRKNGKENFSNIYEVIIGGVVADTDNPVADTDKGVVAVADSNYNPSSLTQSNEEALTKKNEEFISQVEKVCQGVDLKEGHKNEIRKFIEYWTEPNKSHTKLRWEMEKTWDTKRRLRTWFTNAMKFNGGGNKANKYKAVMV